jgi:hypothetical protein
MGLRLKNGSIVERDMASVYIAIEGNPVGDVV